MQALERTGPAEESRAQEIFLDDRQTLYRQTDKLFAYLMFFQWLAGIAAAVIISPRTWIGIDSHVHLHVPAAIFLGGAITSLPVFLAWRKPGSAVTRQVMAIGQMLFSSLLIHLTGGRIETHFHIFGSLAFLAIYRDWRVLVTASAVVTADHFARGIFWPQSIFGIVAPGSWRWVEHFGWVVFEDIFLIISTRRSLQEMYTSASRRAKLEATNSFVEQQVAQRTAALTSAHKSLQDSEHNLSNFFDQAAIGMAMVSTVGRWLYVNRSLCDLLGYTPEELQEKTFQDITHPDDLDRDVGKLNRTLAGVSQSYQSEKRYFHKDGRIVWVLLSVSLIRDQEGKPMHFTAQIQNITERKQAEEMLERTQRELLEVSRQAGRAEVATSVLHNVGNVLNSVNVSCAVVVTRMQESRIESVAKTAALLEAHSADLGEYITLDTTGRKLPAFLGRLGQQLAGERTEVLNELTSLAKNIDHIKEIVAMQQNYAKVSGITEPAAVAALVEDSLSLNDGSLLRHALKVVRKYDDVPDITVEKHKALQILVNLIRNAKHACDDSGRTDKQITVRIESGDNSVRISVTDNGIGIPEENLTRIFAHGFTTKQDGHGFGLHSGALAAREMGGNLTAASEGPGKGATFTLELPLRPPAG